MNGAVNIAAIRAVQAAAMNLTLVCTEIVGPRQMELSMPTAPSLGDPVPEDLAHQAEEIDERESKQ